MFPRHFVILILLCVLPVGVSAYEDPYEKYTEQPLGYREDLEVPWVELETQVKALPQERSLREVELLELPPNMMLSIDVESIEVAEDDIMRAWVVVRSKQGAYNGSYEGLRCDDRTYKIYAHLNPKRSTPLRPVEFPKWREAYPGRYRHELMKDFVCQGQFPFKKEQIVERIRDAANRFNH